MNTISYDDETRADALDEFVAKVSDLHARLAQIASNQRAICPTLQRTAAALRDLAESSRR